MTKVLGHMSPKQYASLSLVRKAQWAVCALGDPGFDFLTATQEQLTAFVDKARALQPTVHGRAVNLFAKTVIAPALRWLIDHGPVTERAFMLQYHRLGGRGVSFGNNIAPYTRYAGAVLQSFKAPALTSDGAQKMARIRETVPIQGATDPTMTREAVVALIEDKRARRGTLYYSESKRTWVRYKAKEVPARPVDMVRWVGPSLDVWFRYMMTNRDLDDAFAAMEKRMLNADAIAAKLEEERDKLLAENPKKRVWALATSEEIAEDGATWLGRIRAEIARRRS